MYQQCKIILMTCETPLHAGSGNEEGVIDLPIQREKHTGVPKMESSGLKGSIREAIESRNIHTNKDDKSKLEEEQDNINMLFGPPDSGEFMGAIGISDARLLLFPVKSLKGVFAWITCPYVINKFVADVSLCNPVIDFKIKGLSDLKDDDVFVSDPNNLSVPDKDETGKLNGKFKLIFDEYLFNAIPKLNDIKVKISEDESKDVCLSKYLADKLFYDDTFFNERFMKHFAIVSNDVFRDFVTLGTEIVTRNKIGENGTVSDTSLFVVEYLPCDSVMYAVLTSSEDFSKKTKEQKYKSEDIMALFIKKLPDVFQSGGNATIGKGLIRKHILNQ